MDELKIKSQDEFDRDLLLIRYKKLAAPWYSFRYKKKLDKEIRQIKQAQYLLAVRNMERAFRDLPPIGKIIVLALDYLFKIR